MSHFKTTCTLCGHIKLECICPPDGFGDELFFLSELDELDCQQETD